MTRTRTTLLVLLCFVSTTSLGEELSAAKHADIEKLLEMTGSLAVGKQMSTAVVQQMTQMLRKARPDIPERVIGFIPEEVDAVIDENMDAFEELVVSIHHKYFTHEMTRFYATPLGQKSIRVMPALMGESMQAGQQWGQSLGPTLRERIEARLKKEGFGPKPE
jgi:uncharacterized protein